MLRLFHCPQTRSTRIIWLLEELNALDEVDIKLVKIARPDGSSTADPDNPHPEGKVPALLDDYGLITESTAIILYLTDRFPMRGLGRSVGDKQRGEYLTWLSYYGGVVEPVLMVHFSSMKPDDLFKQSFRGITEMTDRLTRTLEKNDYLLGDEFSAVDLLIAAPFIWFAAMAPDTPAIRAWVARCAARPYFEKVTASDLEYLAV